MNARAMHVQAKRRSRLRAPWGIGHIKAVIYEILEQQSEACCEDTCVALACAPKASWKLKVKRNIRAKSFVYRCRPYVALW